MANQYPLTSKELTHFINWWCKSLGIKNRDLDNHPQIDDCIFLIKCRENGWSLMNASERGIWAALWSRTYHKQFPLKKSHLVKLENIFKNLSHREEKLNQQRQHIKAIRESKQQKGNVHMTANPFPAADSLVRI